MERTSDGVQLEPVDGAAEAPCVKCGWPQGVGSGRNELAAREPRFYETQLEGREFVGVLEWRCPRCGHGILTRTKDAAL